MTERILDGKIAVVTGASRGLGRAISLALAASGAEIALVGRDRARLEETASAIKAAGGKATAFQTDVTDEGQVAELEREVSSKMGRASILVNNAGVNVRKPITDFTLDEWRLVNDTNLTSVFLLCRAFIPHMKGTGYGRILNMSSMMAHISLPARSAYSSSKAALLGLTKAVALELAPEGITVVAISPGPFATEINTAILENPEANALFVSKIPVGRWGKVEDIGSLTAFLCSDAASFITGTDILIDGGWCAQ